MEDAAVYRHWTDAELELLADRSLAAADVAAATGRTEMGLPSPAAIRMAAREAAAATAGRAASVQIGLRP